MAVQDDLTDALATIRELVHRVEILERQSPLENASITSGTLRVGTPEGLGVESEDGLKLGVARSVKIDVSGAVESNVTDGIKVTASGGLKVDAGGSVKAGAAEISGGDGGKVGAGGTWVNSDGVIRSDGNKVVVDDEVEIRGKTRVAGQLDADSVLMTWGGNRHTVEQVTGWINAALGTTDGIARAAQSTAGTAKSTADSAWTLADSAWDLANGKASQTAHNLLRQDFDNLKTKYEQHIIFYHQT